MKTKEELAMIKSEYEEVKEKLAELTDEELEQVTGGALAQHICPLCGSNMYTKSDLEYGKCYVCRNCQNKMPCR